MLRSSYSIYRSTVEYCDFIMFSKYQVGTGTTGKVRYALTQATLTVLFVIPSSLSHNFCLSVCL
jgi:hypothetical protein